jgi:inner membrane protein
MRFPLLVRTAVVAGIALAILVPVGMIQGKINERRARALEVERSFAAETSGPQVLAGPFLALTCEETYVEERTIHKEEGKPLTVRETRHRPCPTGLFAPKSFAAQGTLPVEQRYRGIFPIRLYRAALEISGDFEWPAAPASTDERKREWKNAYLVIAISDVRGIKDVSGLQVAGAPREFASGAIHPGLPSGLNVNLGSYGAVKAATPTPYRFRLELAGTGRLDIAPVGNSSSIAIRSEWPHPSFVGAFSPDEREISPQGFSARWQVTHHATGGNSFWREHANGDRLFGNPRLLGVALVEPVNAYSLAYRATEYGFLFVLLTFASLLLVEVTWGVKLHPVQYLLVGLALAVFFLLLLALSEHFAFWQAYLCGAAACVALLTFYLRHPLASWARTSVFAAMFTALYGSLYVLLQSEDHALLLGSLLVFAALAAVMVLTRRLDWSSLSKRLAPAPAA